MIGGERREEILELIDQSKDPTQKAQLKMQLDLDMAVWANTRAIQDQARTFEEKLTVIARELHSHLQEYERKTELSRRGWTVGLSMLGLGFFASVLLAYKFADTVDGWADATLTLSHSASVMGSKVESLEDKIAKEVLRGEAIHNDHENRLRVIERTNR